MNRSLESRLAKLEQAQAKDGVRPIICPFPYDEDNPPSREDIEAALKAPPLTADEWEAKFCTPD